MSKSLFASYFQQLEAKGSSSLPLEKLNLKDFFLHLINKYKTEKSYENLYVEIHSFLKTRKLLEYNVIDKKEQLILESSFPILLDKLVRILSRKKEIVNDLYLMHQLEEEDDETFFLDNKSEHDIEERVSKGLNFDVLDELLQLYRLAPSNLSLTAQTQSHTSDLSSCSSSSSDSNGLKISLSTSTSSYTSSSSSSTTPSAPFSALPSAPSSAPPSAPQTIQQPDNKVPTQLLLQYFSQYMTEIISKSEIIVLKEIYLEFRRNSSTFQLSSLKKVEHQSTITINVKNNSFSFMQKNYFSSFLPLFTDQFAQSFRNFSVQSPLNLLEESNRCFFIHLGVALNIHPFLLQSYFRFVSSYYLHKIRKSNSNDEELSLSEEIFSSILLSSNFVDANSLIFLWPFEFLNFELCIISGGFDQPTLSVFHSNRQDLVELNKGSSPMKQIYLYCNDSHFFLLEPVLTKETAASFFQRFVHESRAASLYVQEHEVRRIEEKSLFNYFFSIMQNFG